MENPNFGSPQPILLESGTHILTDVYLIVPNNDEFYTQLTDIEKELRHYSKHFEGKTILCNCDDPSK